MQLSIAAENKLFVNQLQSAKTQNIVRKVLIFYKRFHGVREIPNN